MNATSHVIPSEDEGPAFSSVTTTATSRSQEPLVEPERYELSSGSIHHFELARREFFKLLGAGIAVFAVANNSRAAQETAPSHGFHPQDLPSGITAWLHIGEDGTVTAFCGKVEIGQNIRTSLAQTVADELRVPFESVSMVMGDTALTPFDAGTFGSRTTPTMTPQLRRVASAARDLLIEAAAKEWNVSPGAVKVVNAKLTDSASGRTLTYAALARGKTLAQNLPAEDPVTPPPAWTIAGKPLPKVNARDFVTGRHQYTPDLRRAGMLHGKVLRPPSFGAALVVYDDSAAKSLPGVVVVRDGDFVAAAALTEREATAALAAIHATWKEDPPKPSSSEIFSHLKSTAQTKTDDRHRQQKGSVETALASGAHRLDATYNIAYIAHAPLEPRAALAEWSGDKLTVWTGSQRPFGVRGELADTLRIPESNVRVIVPDTGSAYGGKHTGDAALEAARLARAAHRPVKVVWTREEEFTWAYFRPAGVIEVKSAIGPDGKLLAWDFHNYHSGSSGIETPYVVPNLRTEFHSVPLVLRSGSYRGLAATANHFARETHMDALARAANIDPLEFRLKNLEDARLRAVLEEAAKKFGWPQANRENHGFGIAAGHEKGSYVATCAEITVTQNSGTVRIVRLVTAFECGAIVNPDGLRNQVIGANIKGLGGALFEAIEFENGRITNPRFSRYRVPRFRDIPEIEAVLLDRKDIAPAGAGETPIMAVAPAIGNAIFNATGQRLNNLPLISNGLTKT
jgi:isoquinoline 1-oxidoreductase